MNTEQPPRPAELDYSGIIEKYCGENFNLENARKMCNLLMVQCHMRDRFIRFLEGRIASEIVKNYQSGNTKQPQNPEPIAVFVVGPTGKQQGPYYRISQAAPYIENLEIENTALKEQNTAMKREINQYAEWAKCDIPYPEVK